jgi:prepilin-type N-terminal cleavage/methylation domain-containing protein
MKKEKGFTLIELLVVLTIIVLLASLVFVFLGPARERSRDGKGESDLRQILSAFELKYDDAEAYPDLPDAVTIIPDADARLYPYLNPVPNTNGVRDYYWYDGGDNQKFCVYFQLESEESEYFYSSHRGTGYTNSSACPDF